jgi:hypothetical protein
MFTVFSQLPYELRRAIWVFATPAPLLQNLICDYIDEGLVLVNKHASRSTILHVCQESQGVTLEKCTTLYGTQPLCVNLTKAVITLRNGTLWNLLTLGYIFGDSEHLVRSENSRCILTSSYTSWCTIFHIVSARVICPGCW